MFHKFTNFQKNRNMIWEVTNNKRVNVKPFKEKVNVEISHFSKLLKYPHRCPFVEILKVLRLFPKALGAMNSMFILLIHKKKDAISFEDYITICCCNVIYKLVSKIIDSRLKPILCEIIFEEKFGFLHKCQIHDVVTLTQDETHLIKTSKNYSIFLKLDLSKAFDKVSRNFMHLMLIQMGMKLIMMNWIMRCIYSAFFVFLINGSLSDFFGSSCRLRQGCLISHFLFLLVVEGIRKLIRNARRTSELWEHQVSPSESLFHLLFVDDVSMFCVDSLHEFQSIRRILDLFY